MEDFAFLIFRIGFFIYSIVVLFSLGYNTTFTILLLIMLGIGITLWYIFLELRERIIKNQKYNYCKKRNNHNKIKGASKR